METSLKDCTVRSEENEMRNTLYAVKLGSLSSCIVDLRPVHAKFSSSIHSNLNRLTLPDSNADHLKFLSAILLIHLLDVRNLSLAWAAPR